jgi:hypothetical protein
VEKDVINKLRPKVSVEGFLFWISTENMGMTLSEAQFRAAKLLVNWIRDNGQYLKNPEVAWKTLNSYAGQIMSNRDKSEMIPLFLSYLGSLNHNNIESVGGHLGNAANDKRR